MEKIITSLLETDMYKFSMGQAIYHKFPSYVTTWDFKCRNEGVHFTHEMVEEIREQVKAYCSLSFTEEELSYLSNIEWIKRDYVDFLRLWHPRFEDFSIKETDDGCGLFIETNGTWINTSFYEIPTLAIVNEVYFRNSADYKHLLKSFIERADKKTQALVDGTYTLGAFSEFGMRRRLSAEAQELVIRKIIEAQKTKGFKESNFVGTSNVYLAKKLGVSPVGTMAHEFVQCVGQGNRKHNPAYSNWYMLDAWVNEYGVLNGIALTDTVGTDVFLRDFRKTYATLFSGVRHDSGDPYAWAEKMIAHYKSLGIDPKTKTLLFSDSLDFERASALYKAFKDKARVAFGIGTFIANDTDAQPLNIVMKVTECNNGPVAKISDVDGKNMCKDPAYIHYLKRTINWRLEDQGMEEKDMSENKELINGYKDFLAKGKTERECVQYLIKEAEKYGYKDIQSTEKLAPGDKVYVSKFGKAIALFNIGSDGLEKGINILGAHIDSPRLDVKQNPLYESDFIVYLNTHYYGGIKKYQWLTLPLAIHGVVCKKDGSVVKVCIGEKEDDPVFVISDILPHLAQKQLKETAADFIPGETLDLILVSEIPLEAGDSSSKAEKTEKDKAKKTILNLLKEAYSIEEKDFGSAELEVVPAGLPRDLGLDRSMILAYGQDDRSCAYTSAYALFKSTAGERTNCCLCVDKEEIGSVGATGMASHFFENAVAELIARTGSYSELTLRRCLNNSYMLSSDVNAAYDPQHADLYDKANASFLNGGIVFNKYTGSRGKSGASDASPEFIAMLRNALDSANVKYQMAELGKVDQGGGGTIAYLAAKYGMHVLDAGVSVLSMHAPWEITAKEDIIQAANAYKAFLQLK